MLFYTMSSFRRRVIIKTVFVCDLDGTLLDENTNLHVKHKINELISSYPIVINTLRSPAGMLKELNANYVKYPSIHFGGSLIYNTSLKKTLYYKSISKKSFLRFISFCDIHKVSHRIIYVFKDGISSTLTTYEKGKSLKLEKGLSTSVLSIPFEKIPFAYPVAIYTKDYVNIWEDIKCYKQKGINLYVSSEVDKGSATLILKKILDIDNLVAFGNSSDDFSMLDIANYSFYVGNSSSKYRCIEMFEIPQLIRKWVDNDESL